MKNPVVTSEVKDQDRGLVEFSFLYNRKEYTVRPLALEEGKKPNLLSQRYDKLESFYNFVDYIAPKKKLNPFKNYNWKPYFEITQKGQKLNPPKHTPKQKAEQLSLKLAVEAIDRISDELEEKGAYRESYFMDIVANTLEKKWDSVKVILFADEVANQDIPIDKAYQVIKVFNKGADTEHSVAESTGIDSWTCKVILDIAHKHGLLK